MRAGIDLGTAFSGIATVGTDGVPALCGGRVPSVVTLLADSALAGQEACDEGAPGAVVVRAIKDLLGSDASVVDPAGQPWSGVRVCALLLGKLLDDVSEATGESVDAAVLSVPPGLTDPRRRALRHTAALAGVESLWIVEDGVASGAAYSLGKKPEDEIVLVCDAGYAGFSATLLACAPAGFYVVATEYSAEAGTRSMDAAVGRVFERQFGALYEGETTSGRRQEAWRRLGARVRTDRVGADVGVVSRTVLIGGRTMDVALSQSQLERVLGPALDAAENAIERCLAGACLPRKVVHDVVLSGGGAHAGLLRERVRRATGKEIALLPGIEPQHAVALGAGALGARMAPGVTKLLGVHQAAPLDLGFRVRDLTDDSGIGVLVQKNAPLPAHGSRTVRTTPGRGTVIEAVQFAGVDDPGVGVGVFAIGPADGWQKARSIEIRLGYDEQGFVVLGVTDDRSREIEATAEHRGAEESVVVGPDAFAEQVEAKS